MATVNIVYGTDTALTWSGAIASSTTAGRQSAAIDNTSLLVDDIEVSVSIVFPNSPPANDKELKFFAGGWYGSTAGWQGRPVLTGTDGAYTFNDITTSPTGLQPAGTFFCVQNTTGTFVIPSVATLFGGVLPAQVALAVCNYSGQTITTFTARYRTITYTIA